MTLYHTSRRASVQPHIGFCATESDSASYGDNLFSVAIGAGLTIVDVVVTRKQIDANEWPGDTEEECAAFAADGVDVISYLDMDDAGRQHQTWRLVSARAVAATTVAAVEGDL